MVNTVSAWEARRNFGKLMDNVARRGQPVVVESHGEPKVAVVPVRMLEAWERERTAFFDTMRRAADHANLDEDEAMRIANEVVAEVRAEQRAMRSG